MEANRCACYLLLALPGTVDLLQSRRVALLRLQERINTSAAARLPPRWCLTPSGEYV